MQIFCLVWACVCWAGCKMCGSQDVVIFQKSQGKPCFGIGTALRYWWKTASNFIGSLDHCKVCHCQAFPCLEETFALGTSMPCLYDAFWLLLSKSIWLWIECILKPVRLEPDCSWLLYDWACHVGLDSSIDYSLGGLVATNIRSEPLIYWLNVAAHYVDN